MVKEARKLYLPHTRCIKFIYFTIRILYSDLMTKMVSLSELAYSKLAQKKGKNMSFSDVVLQLLDENKGKTDISEFAGILKSKSKELDKFKIEVLRGRRANLGRKIG